MEGEDVELEVEAHRLHHARNGFLAKYCSKSRSTQQSAQTRNMTRGWCLAGWLACIN